MIERPAKLSPLATLVVWGSSELSLGEKVVWFRDWCLDRGGADGAYASARALSEGLGGNLTPGSVDTIRSRLMRFGLQLAFRRLEGRNPGRICTLPDKLSRPRTGREAVRFCGLLDEHLRLLQRGPELSTAVETSKPDISTQVKTSQAGGPSGGVGGVSSHPLSETQLPSPLSAGQEKGAGSHEPEAENRGAGPSHASESVTAILRRRQA